MPCRMNFVPGAPRRPPAADVRRPPLKTASFWTEERIQHPTTSATRSRIRKTIGDDPPTHNGRTSRRTRMPNTKKQKTAHPSRPRPPPRQPPQNRPGAAKAGGRASRVPGQGGGPGRFPGPPAGGPGHGPGPRAGGAPGGGGGGRGGARAGVRGGWGFPGRVPGARCDDPARFVPGEGDGERTPSSQSPLRHSLPSFASRQTRARRLEARGGAGTPEGRGPQTRSPTLSLLLPRTNIITSLYRATCVTDTKRINQDLN